MHTATGEVAVQYREEVFTRRVVKYWSRLPREVPPHQSLNKLRAPLLGVLSIQLLFGPALSSRLTR